jgi:hypothetical protein
VIFIGGPSNNFDYQALNQNANTSPPYLRPVFSIRGNTILCYPPPPAATAWIRQFQKLLPGIPLI